MATCDSSGRVYAKLADLRAGDTVEVEGLTCCRERTRKLVHAIPEGMLYVECDLGVHFLEGQKDGDGYCVGVYPVSAVP